MPRLLDTLSQSVHSYDIQIGNMRISKGAPADSTGVGATPATLGNNDGVLPAGMPSGKTLYMIGGFAVALLLLTAIPHKKLPKIDVD